jgi:23S rRNA U2552 (ribose-2'-O)-methylase RlmE/FtsJ
VCKLYNNNIVHVVFQDVKVVKPKASRAESSEIYLLARRRKGDAA